MEHINDNKRLAGWNSLLCCVVETAVDDLRKAERLGIIHKGKISEEWRLAFGLQSPSERTDEFSKHHNPKAVYDLLKFFNGKTFPNTLRLCGIVTTPRLIREELGLVKRKVK